MIVRTRTKKAAVEFPSAGGFMTQGETLNGGPVVMLVEDFRDTREMMRRMLETQG